MPKPAITALVILSIVASVLTWLLPSGQEAWAGNVPSPARQTFPFTRTPTPARTVISVPTPTPSSVRSTPTPTVSQPGPLSGTPTATNTPTPSPSANRTTDAVSSAP